MRVAGLLDGKGAGRRVELKDRGDGVLDGTVSVPSVAAELKLVFAGV